MLGPHASSGVALNFPEVCVVLRIFNWLNSRYHCPFLYDDAEEAVVEGLGGLQGLKPRRFEEVWVAAEAATYKASCEAKAPAGGQRYKGTANCRSLVGCGLCRDDSSGRWRCRAFNTRFRD